LAHSRHRNQQRYSIRTLDGESEPRYILLHATGAVIAGFDASGQATNLSPVTG